MKEVMDMKERMRTLRKLLGLTQQEFANQLGISRNNIATYETGKSEPGGSVVSLICKTFNVNEVWIRTGEGEIFLSLSRKQELANAINQFLKGESVSFRERLVDMLIRLDEDEWLLIEKMAHRLMEPDWQPEPRYQTEARLLREEADAVERGQGKPLASPATKDA